jgi:phosphoglycolate phosphatase-like HAD superfamily hydrolase
MQKRPAKFLDNIDKIIFDMDGVITSEENYWNCAALTIYEMLNDSKYFGYSELNVKEIERNIDEIRSEIFYKDKLIVLLKERGINSNWDLAYIVLCVAIIESSNCVREINSLFNNLKVNYEDISFANIYNIIYKSEVSGMEMYPYIEEKMSAITGLEKKIFSRNGELWSKCQDIFQEWSLGEEIYTEEYSKKPCKKSKTGLLNLEEPIIPLERLNEVLKVLYYSNIKLGIGTGRVYREAHMPLSRWRIEKYFDADSYITYTDIINAEIRNKDILKGKHLTKPHPYMFLKGIYGKDSNDKLLLSYKFEKTPIEKTLIVGDAGSDIMAAKAIDCKFAAVLTGISGKKAKKYFEDMGSDYILDNICDLIS